MAQLVVQPVRIQDMTIAAQRLIDRLAKALKRTSTQVCSPARTRTHKKRQVENIRTHSPVKLYRKASETTCSLRMR